ncbi:MAG: EscF/YscF/HrpA family type III secretion system needle major subunit [Desulfovibrionaceae bacterium]|nr:EscF/YscF/HrpA family type III secretion system needle major subunit [Desulfovibrionaceae bacterium]
MSDGVSFNTPGMDLGKMFNDGLNSVGERGKNLQDKMSALLSQENVSPEQMMQVQFEMGQYNAVMESVSSITKSLTDSLKSLAQRAG